MGKWLARTWEGTATKAIIGAALGALLSWLVTADVHPLLVAIGSAVVPVAVNALNSSDSRYGVGKSLPLEEIATMHEFEIEGEQ